jgi:hypothetical protein
VPATTGCETCGADLTERRAARPNGPVRFCSDKCWKDKCWKEAYYGRPEWPIERRDYNARFSFNLPPGRYIEMVREQEGICAIAGCTNEAVSVDQDHRCCDGTYSCGRCVRDILCPSATPVSGCSMTTRGCFAPPPTTSTSGSAARCPCRPQTRNSIPGSLGTAARTGDMLGEAACERTAES